MLLPGRGRGHKRRGVIGGKIGRGLVARGAGQCRGGGGRRRLFALLTISLDFAAEFFIWGSVGIELLLLLLLVSWPGRGFGLRGIKIKGFVEVGVWICPCGCRGGQVGCRLLRWGGKVGGGCGISLRGLGIGHGLFLVRRLLVAVK